MLKCAVNYGEKLWTEQFYQNEIFPLDFNKDSIDALMTSDKWNHQIWIDIITKYYKEIEVVDKKNLYNQSDHKEEINVYKNNKKFQIIRNIYKSVIFKIENILSSQNKFFFHDSYFKSYNYILLNFMIFHCDYMWT